MTLLKLAQDAAGSNETNSKQLQSATSTNPLDYSLPAATLPTSQSPFAYRQLIRDIRNGDSLSFIRVCDSHGLSISQRDNLMSGAITYCLTHHRYEDFAKLQAALRPSNDVLREALADTILYFLDKDAVADLVLMLATSKIDVQVFIAATRAERVNAKVVERLIAGGPEVGLFSAVLWGGRTLPARCDRPATSEVIDRYLGLIAEGDYEVALALRNHHRLPDDIVRNHAYLEAVFTGISKSLNSGAIRTAENLSKSFLPERLQTTAFSRLAPSIQKLSARFNCTTFAELFAIEDTLPKLLEFVSQHPQLNPKSEPKHGAIATKLGLHTVECEELLQAGVDLDAHCTKSDTRALVLALRAHSSAWSDDLNVWGPFTRAIGLFGEEHGYDIMLSYLDRPDLSRHDGLHEFDRVIALYGVSDYSDPRQFAANILGGVSRDNSQYRQYLFEQLEFKHSAHVEFSEVLREVSLDISGTIAKLQRAFAERKELHPLLARYTTPRQVCASWADLLKFRDLERSLHVEEWQALERGTLADTNDPRSRYLRTLLTGRRTPSEIVRHLWQQPLTFWDAGDDTSIAAVHDAVKPSNFFKEPHIRLEADVFRDALLSGKVDHVQFFPPLQVTYFELRGASTPATVQDWLRVALGSRSNRTAGLARDPGTLRTAIESVLKKYGNNLREYANGMDTESSPITDEISDLLLHPKIGIDARHLQAVNATMHAKSDPVMHVANDGISHCMKLGTGKLNVYHLLAETGIFTLSAPQPDGLLQSLASSLVTANVETGLGQKSLQRLARRRRAPVEALIPPNALRKTERVLMYDNAEIGGNFIGDAAQRQRISQFYTDFSRVYLKHFGHALGLRGDLVGLGCDHETVDTLPGAIRWKNRTVPTAILGYSDARKAIARRLPVTEDAPVFLLKKVHAPRLLPSTVREIPITTPGISYLTTGDLIPLSAIEHHAYETAPYLVNGAAATQSTLMAMSYSNAIYGLPLLSLVSRDSSDSMNGYLIAYQGIGGRTLPLSEYSPRPDDPLIYIDDIASLNASSRAGLRLITEFGLLYEQHYLSRGAALPILAEMRQTTTFRHVEYFIERLNRAAHKYGIYFVARELGVTTEGAEPRRTILFEPNTLDRA